MALTIDVGKIKFTWQGTYNAATTYEKDDVVYHDGSAWVCVIGLDSFGNQQTVTGVTPSSSATAEWNKMAQGSDLGSITGLAAGSLLYYNGSDFVNLGVGTAGQKLVVNSGATAPEWGDDIANCHMVNMQTQTRTGAWQTGTSYADIPGFSIDYTPLRSDTVIIYKAQFLASWQHTAHAIQHFRTTYNGTDVDYWTLGSDYYADIVMYEWRVASWGTTQQNIKLRTREYSSNGHMIRFFETQYWDGGGTDQDNTENRCTIEEWKFS